MTDRSLSEIYRQMTARAPLGARAMIDSDTAVRASTGRVVPSERLEVAGALASSAAHADLVRFLRALEPASAELAQSLPQLAPAHEHRERHQRVAHGRRGERGWQWGALAASLVAAVALFAARGGVPGMGDQAAFARLQSQPSDSIFGNNLDTRFAHEGGHADAISKAGFNDARPDVIFRSSGG